MATARFQIFSVASRVANQPPDRGELRDGSPAHKLSWRFLSANNRSLGQSAVSYSDVESCLVALRELQKQLAEAACVTVQDSPGQWMWRISVDGPDLARSSRRYQRRVEAQYACMSFRALAERTAIIEPLQIVEF